jgi:prepilin-type N-terminal cleavage/methylation domain-containing protein
MSRSAVAPPSADEAGFTLLELLVCLVLLAVISAVVVPRFTTDRPPTLEERARRIVEDLSLFRRAAMATGTVQTASSEALAEVLPPEVRLGKVSPRDFAFLPNGTTNGGVWWLETDGEAVAIRVDWLTGRVTVDTP